MNLTLERAKELLAVIVAEYGEDYAYEKPWPHTTCRYVHISADGELTPGCIVGVLLHKFGFELERLHRVLLNPVFPYFHDLKIMEPEFTFEPQVRELLQDVQFRQDAGVAWSQAVREAIEEVEG